MKSLLCLIGSALQLLSKGIAFILLVPILVYRRLISPFTPPSCRFSPTCSAYAEEALRSLGAFRATPLIVWRVLRCQPFCRGGYDPVPHSTSSAGTSVPSGPSHDVDPRANADSAGPKDPHGD